MNIIIRIFVIAFIFLSTNSIYAQAEKSEWVYGIGGHFGMNMHTADFNKLKDIPNCCPQFESGDGLGFSFLLLTQYRLNSALSLGTRLTLMDFGGEMESVEDTYIILNGALEPGKFTHYMTGKLMTAGLEPSLIYHPIDNFNIAVGVNLGYLMLADYEQMEKVTDPARSGTFADENGDDTFRRIRNENSGAIPDASSMMMNLMASVSYDLPLNKNSSLMLSPEIAFYYGPQSYVADVNWKVNSLRGGLTLKYNPIQTVVEHKMENNIDTVRVPVDTPIAGTVKMGIVTESERELEQQGKTIVIHTINRTDTLYVEKQYNIAASIDAIALDENNAEQADVTFKIEEYTKYKYQPLLNYVFFDEGSDKIPDRYTDLDKSATNSFKVESLYKNGTIENYHHLLNIVGRRMTDNPKAILTLVGCNSDIDSEKADIKLSENRALAVQKYLHETWNIAMNRLVVKKRNQPELPSVPLDEPDKTEENRRVELYSDNDKILEPIFTTDTLRKMSPPYVVFRPEISSDLPLKQWRIKAYQGDNAFLNLDTLLTGNSPKEITWDLNRDQKKIPTKDLPIDYQLFAEDTKANKASSQLGFLPVNLVSIRMKQKNMIDDIEIGNYSLILFKFNSAKIEDRNKKIARFIKSQLKPDSKVTIVGHSDRSGEDEYNKNLSLRRAESAKNAVGAKNAQVFGVGEQDLIYDNNYPEGRFYCRTVNITIETVIKR